MLGGADGVQLQGKSRRAFRIWLGGFGASRLRFWRRLFNRGVLHDKLTALAVPALDIVDAEIPRFTQLAEREKRRVAWAVAGVSLALALVVSALGALRGCRLSPHSARRSCVPRKRVSTRIQGRRVLLTLLPDGDPPEGGFSVGPSRTRH